MRDKKFAYYKVIIEYQDGKKRDITEDTDYKNMLKNYRDIKKAYSNKKCKLSFIGIKNNNESEILWEKNTLKEDVPTLEVIEKNIKSISDMIYSIDYNTKGTTDALNKKQDIILHKIECVEASDLTGENLENEKLKLMDELIKVREERREIKYLDTLKNDIQGMTDRIDNIQEKILKIQKTKQNFHSYNKINNTKSQQLQELKYRNDEQKNNIYNLFETMFAKVVIDELNKKVIGYNNCYH